MILMKLSLHKQTYFLHCIHVIYVTMKKYCIALLFGLAGCGDDESPKAPVVKGAEIIMEAKVLGWNELPENIKLRAGTGWIDGNTFAGGEKIEKETGYYLRMTVKNDLVAKASCDTNTLKKPDLMAMENRYIIYGKYRNNLQLYGQNGKVIRYEAKRSHTLIDILRNGTTDTTYWGPLEQKPDSLIFNCWNLDSANQARRKVL